MKGTEYIEHNHQPIAIFPSPPPDGPSPSGVDIGHVDDATDENKEGMRQSMSLPRSLHELVVYACRNKKPAIKSNSTKEGNKFPRLATV